MDKFQDGIACKYIYYAYSHRKQKCFGHVLVQIGSKPHKEKKSWDLLALINYIKKQHVSTTSINEGAARRRKRQPSDLQVSAHVEYKSTKGMMQFRRSNQKVRV
jgi:hypothetical protein